jgi:radical SAM superfamily enzyme YgiQ (UPF0313 family)
MYRAGCRVVFIGYETNDAASLQSLNKNQNLDIDFKEVVRNIHRKKIAVIASTILGLDNQTKGYHKKLIRELKRIKVDLVRVFYITAWPGTPFYRQMKKENRIHNEWDTLRKDIPTLKYKHYTKTEIISARNEVIKAFYNQVHGFKIIFRWFLRDRNLVKTFLHIRKRNVASENIRNQRALDSAFASK